MLNGFEGDADTRCGRGCRWLRPNQNGRIFQEGTGNGDALLFSAGEPGIAFNDPRVVAVGSSEMKSECCASGSRFGGSVRVSNVIRGL